MAIMSDIENSSPVAEVIPAASPAPVAAAPAAVVDAPAPVVAAPDAPAPAPVVEAAVAADPQLSLLGDEPVEAKPAEVKAPDAPVVEAKPADAPVVEAKPVDAPVEAVVLPTYEPFKLPEGVAGGESLDAFTKELAAFEASKPTHEQFQAFGQKIVDQHTAAMKAQTDHFIQLCEKQKATDLESLRNDPVIGKGGDQDAFQAFGKDFVNFIARNGGTKEEVTAFREFTKERGVDNALPIIRVINNLKNKIDRYEKEASKMLPGTKPAAAAPAHPGKGMTGRLYGGASK